MSIRRKLRNESEVNTGPLNDILFILLLFFLIVSTLANPNVIRLSLPKATSDTKAKQTIVVSVTADDKLYVGTELVNVSDLEIALGKYLQKDKDIANPSVVINADKKATIDQVVYVMKIARKLGANTALSIDNTK